MHAGVQDSLLSTPLRPPPFHSAPKAQRHPKRPSHPASEALCHCTSRGGRLGLAVLPAASRSCRHGPCRPRCATTPPPPRAQDSTQHPHGAGTEPHRRGKHCCVLHPRTRCSCCDCAGLVHGVRSVAAKALRRHSLTCGGAGVPCSWCSSACAGSVTDGLKGEGHADAATQRLVLRVRGSTLRAAVVRHHGGLNVTLSERPSDAEASVSHVAEAEAVQALNPMKAKCLIASCVSVCLEVLSMPRDTCIVPVKAWMAWCLPQASLAAL